MYLFKTFEQAADFRDTLAGQVFPNRFQSPDDNKGAIVVEFSGGWGVQLGDFGPYITLADVSTTL